MIIVKHWCWVMNYRSHRVNFDSFAPLVGANFGEIFGYEDFYTVRFVFSVFYTTTTFYSF
jgi:hypothetical protein